MAADEFAVIGLAQCRHPNKVLPFGSGVPPTDLKNGVKIEVKNSSALCVSSCMGLHLQPRVDPDRPVVCTVQAPIMEGTLFSAYQISEKSDGNLD